MLVDLYFPELKPSLEAFRGDFTALQKMIQGDSWVPTDELFPALEASYASGDKISFSDRTHGTENERTMVLHPERRGSL